LSGTPDIQKTIGAANGTRQWSSLDNRYTETSMQTTLARITARLLLCHETRAIVLTPGTNISIESRKMAAAD
jgi:hypothetical protein